MTKLSTDKAGDLVADVVEANQSWDASQIELQTLILTQASNHSISKLCVL